ncbi:MAG TPA: hypothetical protein VEC14_02960, partial [Reyranellaceae bacterium]|nr:hypothetical protein [Reyranellaceae bacterium]
MAWRGSGALGGWLACIGVAIAAAMLFVAPHSVGQPTRTADITVNVVGDESFGKELGELVENSEKEQPSSGDAIAVLQGVEAHRQRIARALRSRGYYGGDVTATVAGRPLVDPDLVAAIEARPPGEKVGVVLAVTTGPVYRIGSLNVTVAAPETAPPLDRTKLALAPGKAADTAAILQVEDQVLVQAREAG